MSNRDASADISVAVTTNGPYLVKGKIPLARQTIEADPEGQSREWQQGQEYEVAETYALCRCGQSAGKPFCDGTHARIHFNGTERASKLPYLEQADVVDGPAMYLTDAQRLCAFARFCDPDGQVWNLIEQTDEPEKQEMVQHEAGHCPAGRLVAWFKETQKPYEPEFESSIGLVEDPQMGVSGGLWLRGSIPVTAADGTQYEVRNRVALCRCGASGNKPFCDGSHVSVRFSDDH
jgi:CDGSH-type Zn-finger protein